MSDTQKQKSLQREAEDKKLQASLDNLAKDGRFDADHNQDLRKLIEQEQHLGPAAVTHEPTLKRPGDRPEPRELVSQHKADELRARQVLLNHGRQETELIRPADDHMARAEESRNAYEMDKLRLDHEKILKKARAAADNAMAKGLSQDEANQRVVDLAKQLDAQRQAKVHEQQQRWKRIEDQYGRHR